MAVKLTPEEFADKHARRLKGAIDDMRAGIERVDEAPGKKAAAKKAKWADRMSRTETHDKWAKRVGEVPLDSWKKKMTDKGLPRVAGGIDDARDKVVNFAEALIDHQNAGLKDIEKMPDLTLEDSIARAQAWIRHMAKFKR